MPFVWLSIKLAIYLCCIGWMLKYTHKLSSDIDGRIASMSGRPAIKAVLAFLAAMIPSVSAFAATLLFAYLSTPDAPFSMLGLSWDSDSLSMTWSGIVLGFTCVMLMFSAGLLMGYIRVSWTKDNRHHSGQMIAFCAGSSDYITGAIIEEIVIRGYVYYVLNETLGWSMAVVVSSVIFALAHLIRPNRIPLVFTINALFFGLLTGVCRYVTGGLWLPIGLHLAWNVTAGPLLGLPYSGSSYEKGLIKSDVSGPVWLMGGFYSPDAGMLGTGALLLAAIGVSLIAPNFGL